MLRVIVYFIYTEFNDDNNPFVNNVDLNLQCRSVNLCAAP